MAAQDTDRTAQVRIQLRSQAPDLELPESTGPILVSTELRRYQLSTLVNRLLSTEKPIPFEFVINGIFLRTSIDDFLTEQGISSETTLQVEYVRAQIPPQHVTSFQHDDWVSSVDLLSSPSDSASQRILSASYDGLLRTWSASGDCVATSPASHTGPVKSVKFLSPNLVVSSSLDRSVRMWSYSETSPSSGAFTPTLELLNHTASVDRLAVHQPSQKILAASSDHTLSIFSSSKSSSPEAPAHLIPTSTSSKRRKLSNHAKPLPQRGALATLRSHSAPVSDVTFAPQDHTVAYSTSWDHSLKTWDLTTARCVDTRTTSHALLSVLPLQDTGLVAAGTSARHISLIDPRATASSIVAMTLRGHANAVVSLTQSPESGSVLASASHDGTVRVWDVRMAAAAVDVLGEGGSVADPLFVLSREGGTKKNPGGEGQKVFDVKWDGTWGIVSAGEDKRVQVHQER
ncbi:putative microtubule associated protein [Myriangium duriaei CBS 260.36]|uniref:Ribosome biogenesis protein YTM1 n=1 Tax=Myriangium duriaei CBS 260.36 TaxID=1168546 RepID=A0A9P4JA51_9PEZI|nr:putative microtubule associated protein [Myriangium duriaei CBS 260.36]